MDEISTPPLETPVPPPTDTPPVPSGDTPPPAGELVTKGVVKSEREIEIEKREEKARAREIEIAERERRTQEREEALRNVPPVKPVKTKRAKNWSDPVFSNDDEEEA